MTLARQWLPLLLVSLFALPVLGQREPTFMLVKERAPTPEGLATALKATLQSVGERGDLVLTALNPLTDEAALLFQVPERPGAETAPPWSRATVIAPRRSRVTLLVEARNKPHVEVARTFALRELQERAVDVSTRSGRKAVRMLMLRYLLEREHKRDRSVGVPVAFDITLQELHELRNHPARQRNTLLGAMLRRRWERALDGTPDDPNAITPRITPLLQTHPGGVAFQQPWFTSRLAGLEPSGAFRSQPFDEDDVNDLLGRTRRPRERINAARAGEAPRPLRSISDPLDRALESALAKARSAQYVGSDAVWRHLNALRSGPPRRLDPTDHAFLASLHTSGSIRSIGGRLTLGEGRREGTR